MLNYGEVKHPDSIPMGALHDPRHECYAREVAAGSSMRLAWIMAGFPETSRNWARLARRRNVARRIEELRAEFNAAAGIHLRYIQEKLLAIAGADITNYFQQNQWGTLSIKRNLAELPREVRAAIAELRIDRKGQVQLKLESKSHAIDTLLKTLPGALAAGKVDINHNVADDLAATIDRAMARAALDADALPMIELTPQVKASNPEQPIHQDKVEVGERF